MMVTVANEQFKTKQALLDRLRSILRGYPLGAFVSADDAAFLTAALEQANEFYGYPAEEPVAWRIQCQAFGRHPEFVFSRPDGTLENPSIKRLSLQKSKKGKTAASAARRDISDQILAFRASKPVGMMFSCDDPQCSFTSNNGTDFDVDHDEPLFSELFEGWCSDEILDERQIEIVEVRDASGVMTDYGMRPDLAESFRNYHQKHARLQLLCRGCHAHKTFRHAEQ